MRLAFVLILFTLLTLSCDPPSDTRLKLYNNSNSSIIFMDTLYDPDSSIIHYNQCSDSGEFFGHLFPNEITTYRTGPGGNWENIINKEPNDKIIFLVYNADSVSKLLPYYGCDGLRNRKDLILKHFSVTVDYLNRNDWTLTYP